MAMKKNVCSTFTGRPTAGSLMSLANLADRRNILFFPSTFLAPSVFHFIPFLDFWILVPHFLLLWSDILEKGELPVFFIVVFFGNKILTAPATSSCWPFLKLHLLGIFKRFSRTSFPPHMFGAGKKGFLPQRGMSEISDWKRMAEVCYILWETISWHCDVGIFYHRLISNVQHDWSSCAIKPMHGLYQLLCWLKLIKLLL